MMHPIKLKDNRFGANAPLFKCEQAATPFGSTNEELNTQTISKNGKQVLKKFNGCTLAELVAQGKDAVVDLSQLQHLDDKGRKKLCFFKLADDNDNQFRLETGNLMGVLRFRDKETSVQVEILSRFDNEKNNFFLNYLLSKVYNFAIGVEAVSAERSSLLPILLDIVFVRRLGEAAKAGLLRHYREFRNNDWSFKGSLDLARHIRENIPLMHGIAYRKREIDLDVPVNRMILMAALTVNRRLPSFFEGNQDAADALCQLRMGVTEERDLRAVLSHRDCRETVSHPFFREVWEPLRQIARMILEDEQWTLFPETTTEYEVSGIVFDGSWLWEEYIAKVLGRAGFEHSVKENGAVKRVLPVFRDGDARFAPDFYHQHEVDDNGEKKTVYDCVFDAKYKRSNPNGGRNDVHQVLCYLLLTGAKLGGLVFPPVDEKCEDSDSINAEENGGLDNKGIKAKGKVAGWSIPREISSPYSKEPSILWSCFSWGELTTDGSWHSFEECMGAQEDKLLILPTEPSFWVELLSGQPQFADKCPWEKLKDSDWEALLAKQPQLAKYRR